MNPKPKFVYVTYIRTTPEKLWHALTTQEIISQYWSGRTNESTWKKGATLTSHSPKGNLEWSGKILDSKKPSRLVYTFGVASLKEKASRVTFDIKRAPRNEGGALRLTVTHDQFPPKTKIYSGIQEGWPAILSRLKTLLETNEPFTFLTWD
jgi:uncharacterized protein YndB with AHSA1/START domain